SAFHTAAGKIYGPALRPMISATCRIDLWCTAKFGEARNHGFIEHPSLHQVLEQRAVTLIVHRRNNVPHSCDRREWFRAMDVPGDLIEHGNKGVDRHETHT